MSVKEVKTNAMRILESEGINFETGYYECDEFIDGVHTADALGLPHEMVYKTLVTVGNTVCFSTLPKGEGKSAT